jgi:E3 ubiquitin-protein ligase HUWE1
MSNVIVNVLYEIERNVDFWEKFEIKYHSNNDINKYNNLNVEENRKELNEDIPMKDLGEVVDEGPHKGIQTKLDINSNNGDKINPSLKVLSDISNDLKKDNNSNNNINSSFNSRKYFINNRNENRQPDINKTIPMKNNSNDIKNNSGKEFNDDYSNKDNVNYYFNSQSKDLNKIKKFNNNINNNNYFSNSISNTKCNTNANVNFSSNQFDNFNNNLKNENTLQSCYEKFKKERLMKKSLLKPNIKSKDKNKKSYNIFNAKSQKVQNKKLNSLSTPKISTSKKYLKENSQTIQNWHNMYNIYDMNSKLKFNKKEDDIDIDLDIDFDVNKIRPNFDPNLYSMQTNKKYSQNARELIQPLLTDDDRKFSRYNPFENGNENQILSEDFNGRNIINNINRNIGSNNFILNEDLNSIKNLNENLRSNNHINNIDNKEKSIINSSKKSHKNTDKANEINNAINVLLDNKNNGDINNGYDNTNDNYNSNINQKSISSKDITHDLAYINNIKIDQKSNIDNVDNMINNLRSYENENNVYDTENKNKYLNFYSNDNNQKSVELDKNLITSNTYSSGKPDFFINNRKPSINNNIPIDENALFNNNYKETISTDKRNYINDKINNFENKLNYYGQ